MPKPLVTPIDRHIGDRLKQLRQQEGISAAVLAEAIDSTQQQISRYENGQNKLGAAQLYRIALSLDVPVSWFFKGIDLKAESINKISSQNDAVKIEDELQSINKIWPKLNSTQRLAIVICWISLPIIELGKQS